MATRKFVRLIFGGGWEPKDAELNQMRGYSSHVWAELDDGSRHPMTFYNTARMQQTLDDAVAQGEPFFSDPGLVIVTDVTPAIMEEAARHLAEHGFFEGRW
jgi:hypothetical protein